MTSKDRLSDINPATLEQLGLFYMLERLQSGRGSVQDIVRVRLRQERLIDGNDPPSLTSDGIERLNALRRLVTASND